MNREIKFRAWSKATEKMMDWDFIKSHGNLNKLLCLGHVKVMQFTGLTDKNGKEIYEGDILKCDGLRIVIQYSGCAFEGRYLGPQKDLWSPIRNNNYLQWVVIGNIHQNPELLKP